MDRHRLDNSRRYLDRIRIMKTIIISLGGSLIVPDKIDTNFLAKFRKLILRYHDKYRFVIYCGGGSTARKYQKALKKVIGNGTSAMDWMGISATYLNAFLMRSVFGIYADPDIIENPTKKVNSKKKILIACGWKPGWSTDYDAVLIAKTLKSGLVINMTNVDYLYDKDPKYKSAKPVKDTTYKEIKKIIGTRWTPGLNAPFDPVAIKAAEKLGIKVIISGKSIANLKNILDGKDFKGTLISE